MKRPALQPPHPRSMSWQRMTWGGGIRSLAARAMRLVFAVMACCCLGPRPAWSQCRGDRLDAPGVGANDQFGFSVAVHGQTAVVGSPQDGPTASTMGSVDVFRRSGTAWTAEVRFEASAGEAWFGWSVAAGNDVVVVGVPQHRFGGTLDAGAAHVYRRSASGWYEEAVLVPSDSLSGFAGQAVAIDGDTIVMGASDRLGGGGAVYVFRRSRHGWIEDQKLTPGDLSPGDSFGWSVALSGDRCVVGAINDDPAGTLSGSAYVFRRIAGGWIEEAKLTASDGRFYDRFGYAVSISGDTILVGQPEGSPFTSLLGSVYVFRQDGLTWLQEAKLRPIDGVDGNHFGSSVSLDCDLALVGAPYGGTPVFAVGAAYLFERTGTGWIQREEITDCSPDDIYSYGYSVSLSRGTALISALGDDAAGTDAGGAFTVEVEGGCGCRTCADLLATIDSASIDREGVRGSLRVKAVAACRAYNRDRASTSGNVLCALVQELDAQAGQHVEQQSAEEIRTCVQSVADALAIPLGHPLSHCFGAMRARSPIHGRR